MANRNRVMASYTITVEDKERLVEIANRSYGGNASLALSTIIRSIELPPEPPSMKWKGLTTSREEIDAIGRVKAKQSTENNKAHAKRIGEGKKLVE